MRRTAGRLVLAAGLLALGGCADRLAGLPLVGSPAPASPPQSVPAAAPAAPLSYDYLPKLRLDVSDVIVDDTWTPRADSGEHVEDLATPRPAEALSRMAHDRIIPGGGAGPANVVIEDAALVRLPGQLIGSFSVRVRLPDGAQAVATVSGTRTLASDGGERETANALVGDLMSKMNVELEYQIRHELRDHIAADGGRPGSVSSESLSPPAGSVAAPAPPPQ